MALDNDMLFRQFQEQTARVQTLSDTRDALSDANKAITRVRRRENQAFQLQRAVSDDGNAFIAVTNEYSELLRGHLDNVAKRARQLKDEIELYESALDDYHTRLREGDSETNEGASDEALDVDVEVNTNDADDNAYTEESWG